MFKNSLKLFVLFLSSAAWAQAGEIFMLKGNSKEHLPKFISLKNLRVVEEVVEDQTTLKLEGTVIVDDVKKQDRASLEIQAYSQVLPADGINIVPAQARFRTQEFVDGYGSCDAATRVTVVLNLMIETTLNEDQKLAYRVITAAPAVEYATKHDICHSQDWTQSDHFYEFLPPTTPKETQATAEK